MTNPVKIDRIKANLAGRQQRNAARAMLAALQAAVLRVQLANTEGNPILSAWLPDARAAIAAAESAGITTEG